MPLYPSSLSATWQYTDRGLLAENIPAALAGGTTLGTAGRLEGAWIRLPTAATVTNLVIVVTTAGNTLTANQCLGGLWNADLTPVASTADQAAAWVSTGVKTMALAGGPFVLAAGLYAATVFYNGTTGPTIARGGNTLAALANHGFPAPAARFFNADTGRTTSNPASLGAQTATANAWYFALT